MTCYADPSSPTGHSLRHEHGRECTPSGCLGCKPCAVDEHGDPTRHCGACRGPRHQHLARGEYACARCVGKVRGDLHAVLDCAAAMPEEARHDGIESEAFALAGPVARLEDWTRRMLLAVRSGVPLALLDRDETDPHLVIGGWEWNLRLHLGHAEYVWTSEGLSGSVAYLDQQLTHLAQHPDDWWLVVKLRADVAKVRSHLEAVLHDSRGPERGAPCPACAERAGAAPDDPDSPEIARAPRLVLQRVDEDTSGASDAWVCPACDATWREADYRLRVTSDYLVHATALTADQMAQQYRVKPSTLRTWAERGQVARRGRDGSDRLLYDVAQALAQRDAQASA